MSAAQLIKPLQSSEGFHKSPVSQLAFDFRPDFHLFTVSSIMRRVFAKH